MTSYAFTPESSASTDMRDRFAEADARRRLELAEELDRARRGLTTYTACVECGRRMEVTQQHGASADYVDARPCLPCRKRRKGARR